MPTIKANGAEFYYELNGQGKPVILIAGYTCDSTSWQAVSSELSKHFQVLVFDNRGIGRTKDDNAVLTAKLMADDVIALAEQLHLKHPTIVGQSMGGKIAQTIAALYPEKIDKLCLLTTSAKWRQAMLLGFKSLLDMREKNIDFDLIFAVGMPWIFGEAFLKNEKNISAYKKIVITNPYPQSLQDQKRQYQMLRDFDGRTQVKNIKASTLVVYGRQDLVSLPAESKFLASEIPHATLEEFDCAHGIMVEMPEKLSETLIKFIKQ